MSREYTRDASEYGQQLIADAIRSLSGSNGGGSSTPSSEDIADLLKIHIDVEQTEHQTIQYSPALVGVSYNGTPMVGLSMSNGLEEGGDFDLGLLTEIKITPDEGYTAGELILPEGVGSLPEGNGRVMVILPLGSSITLSATPATLTSEETESESDGE